MIDKERIFAVGVISETCLKFLDKKEEKNEKN